MAEVHVMVWAAQKKTKRKKIVYTSLVRLNHKLLGILVAQAEVNSIKIEPLYFDVTINDEKMKYWLH